MAALLLLAPTPTSGSPAAGPSAPQGAEERRGRAQAAFEHGRFAEAALEYEALWREGQGASDLFNAAASRFALRHYTHAVAHLEALLALPSLTAAQRGEAANLAKIARSKTRAVPLELRTPRPLDAPLALTLEAVSAFASDIRPNVSVTIRPGQQTVLSLDPGAWRLHVEDPRFEPLTLEVRVDAAAAPAPQVLDLRPRQDTHGLRRFALGWSVAGGAGLVLGAGLLGGGQRQWSSRHDAPIEGCQAGAPNYPLPACRDALAGAANLRAAGAGLFGVGAGALAGGLIALAPDPRGRRLGWTVTASVGALATIGGAIALGLGARSFADHNDRSEWTPDERQAVARAAATHTVGATFVGLGAGALASSITGLVLNHKGRFVVSAGPQLRLGGAALLLEGRF